MPSRYKLESGGCKKQTIIDYSGHSMSKLVGQFTVILTWQPLDKPIALKYFNEKKPLHLVKLHNKYLPPPKENCSHFLCFCPNHRSNLTNLEFDPEIKLLGNQDTSKSLEVHAELCQASVIEISCENRELFLRKSSIIDN